MLNPSELSDHLSQALDENETLRHEIERLQSEGSSQSAGPLDNNPLCRGCYRWRLCVSGTVGLAVGLYAAAELRADGPLLRSLSYQLTGHSNNADLVLTGIVLASTFLPAQIVVGEWKWTLFKNGYPGLLRGLVDMFQAFRGGLGK